MIRIDFEVDPDRAAKDAAGYSPLSPACSDLTFWLFSFRTRWIVNGVSVLAGDEDRGPRIPIARTAISLYDATRAVQRGRTWVVDIVGVTQAVIEVEREGDAVRIRNDFPQVDVTVGLEEFVEAAREFGDRVRTFVLGVAPAAVADEIVGWWFRGDEPSPSESLSGDVDG